MRWFAAVALVVFMAVSPASAGTATDPEITDPCGDISKNAGMEPAASWEDICKVWFDTATSAGGVVVTVETGALQPRTPTVHAVSFNAGGCRMSAVSKDASGPDATVGHALYVQCSEAEQVPCPVPLPNQGCWATDDPIRVPLDGAVTETATTLRFAITPELLPENLRGLLATGQVVTNPVAWSGPLVAGQTLNAGAPCEDLTCASKIGDATRQGRSFDIGS